MEALSPSKILPPGPRGLPLIGHLHLLGRLPHRSLQQLSHVHGPLMQLRLGSVPVIVASSPAMAREVLKTHDEEFASRPYLLIAEFMGYNSQNLVLAPYGDHWRMLRKLCLSELLAAKRIDSFLQVRMEEVSSMVSRLQYASARKEVVQVRSLLLDATFNTILRILVGEGVVDLNAKVREFRALAEEILQLGGSFNVSEFFPRAFQWIDWNIPRFRELHVRQEKFLHDLMDEHKAGSRDSIKQEFIDVLISNFPGDMQTVKAVLSDLLTAGSDTATTAIEWTLAELLRNPQALKKAQEELDAVVGQDRMVCEEDIPKLTYMNAVIKEGFRLHPPSSLLLPHMSRCECKVGDYDVPKGATLLVNIYAIGRDPAVWADPAAFLPERFLTGDGIGKDVRGQDYELLPFGSGRRSCPGLQLGLRTVQIVLANLVHGFHWSFPGGKACSMDEAPGFVNRMTCPLQAVAATRLPPHAFETIK